MIGSRVGSSSLFACDLHLGERAEVAPAPQGDRFLLLEPAGDRWPTLILVDNWRAQLEPKR
ncbi:MAG TPA: hypothetical protein VMS86_10460 [Thermoanaerobaculia bacterium]|nr:hypothetical protein [Thermoanaerobaculia bacterium]